MLPVSIRSGWWLMAVSLEGQRAKNRLDAAEHPSDKGRAAQEAAADTARDRSSAKTQSPTVDAPDRDKGMPSGTQKADEDTYSKAKISAAAAKKAQAKAPGPISDDEVQARQAKRWGPAQKKELAGVNAQEGATAGAMPQAAGAMNATAAPPPKSPAQILYGNTPMMSGNAASRPMEGGSRA